MDLSQLLLFESPDKFIVNNIEYSFSRSGFCTFFTKTIKDPKITFYSYNNTHLYIIGSIKNILTHLLKKKFQEIRILRSEGEFKFSFAEHDKLTKEADELLKDAKIFYSLIGDKPFSIYDLFFFIDSELYREDFTAIGRLWDRGPLLGNDRDMPLEFIYTPAASFYNLSDTMTAPISDKIILNLIPSVKRTSEDMFKRKPDNNKMPIEIWSEFKGAKVHYIDIPANL